MSEISSATDVADDTCSFKIRGYNGSEHLYCPLYVCVTAPCSLLDENCLSVHSKLRLLFDVSRVNLCPCFVFQSVLYYADVFVYVNEMSVNTEKLIHS